MRVLVTGASGFIGQRLCARLSTGGHEVWALRRAGPAVPHATATLVADLSVGPPDLAAAAPEAVVHLAGESIGAGRWTAARKSRLARSRVLATQHLAEALVQLAKPPAVAVCASAVGYYGNRGDERLTEAAGRGEGYLAELCEAWEAESAKLLPAGRVTIFRFGMVVGPGGAIPRLFLPFRLGIGGPLGGGKQWVSWIALEDACGLVRFAIENEPVAGTINAVAPEPLRGRDFARAVGRALHRPSWLPAPAPLLRAALGDMARELLLSSQRAVPERAVQLGYRFAFPDLPAALRAALEA